MDLLIELPAKSKDEFTRLQSLTLVDSALTIARLAQRMFAIVSDIHANLEAFTVVLEEIQRRGIEHIVCLGDVVGYGPNPMECLDLVATRARATLMGNHDFAVFYEPFNFNSGAEAACFWTRQQFENDSDVERRAN